MLTHIKVRILEKLEILSHQITPESLNELEQEFVKFNPTKETVYDFKTGYSYHDNLFTAGFNLRATNININPLPILNWNIFFRNVIQNLSNNTENIENLEGIDDTLTKLIEIKVYPEISILSAMYLDFDNSIAIRIQINKKYNEERS